MIHYQRATKAVCPIYQTHMKSWLAYPEDSTLLSEVQECRARLTTLSSPSRSELHVRGGESVDEDAASKGRFRPARAREAQKEHTTLAT